MPKIDSTVPAGKLPREGEHAEALRRMQALRSYYSWTLDLFRPWLGRRILDAGCGNGNFTALMADFVDHVVAVDLSPQNIDSLRRRFAEARHVEIVQADLEDDISAFAEKQLDTVACLDVLEHVKDDERLLSSLRSIVDLGGHLLLKVPACQCLYGSVDLASGHYRRYSRRQLRDVATRAGWSIVRLRYMNVLGVIPYFLKSRVLKRATNYSRTFSSRQLGLIAWSARWLKYLDRVVGPPFGQSLILVARRS